MVRLVPDTEETKSTGLTDTDDANVALREGKPVGVVYPDQLEPTRGARFRWISQARHRWVAGSSPKVLGLQVPLSFWQR